MDAVAFRLFVLWREKDDLGWLEQHTAQTRHIMSDIRREMWDPVEDAYRVQLHWRAFGALSATWRCQTWKIGWRLCVKRSAGETSIDWPVLGFVCKSASSDNEVVARDGSKCTRETLKTVLF